MAQRFDLIVLGTGTAASTVAYRCRRAGRRVAVIDSRPFGGTCALRGCDPKKVLVGAAEVVDWSRRMTSQGVRGESTAIEWTDLMRFKRSFTDPVPANREEGFAEAGIATFHGATRFEGPTAVRVGDDILESQHIVIATGAAPATLGILGEEHLLTSDRFLELASLPARIVFVGGGYISLEFAHVASRVGAQVTVIHRGARPLLGFDPDMVDLLVAKSQDIGIQLELSTGVEAVERSSGGLTVRARTDGVARTFPADLVVHGAGRAAEIDDLDLDAGGVERGQRGVKVNEFLQSVSNPAVYAAGDAAETAGLPLTPVAGLEGRVVADNLLHGNQHRADYTGIPSVVFTIPPLSAVGLREDAARAQGLRFRVNTEDTAAWYSSRRVRETRSGFKVLIEEGSERILGAHLFGPLADEIVNLFAVAIRGRLTARVLKDAIFAYPTHASDVPYML